MKGKFWYVFLIVISASLLTSFSSSEKTSPVTSIDASQTKNILENPFPNEIKTHENNQLKPSSTLTPYTSNLNSKAVCWEISGNGLKQSSYLFGTFHLLNDSYLNKLSNWKNRFKKTKSVVVEMVIDSARLISIMEKMMSPDTTLDQLLTNEEYELTSKYLKETGGYDLTAFNNYKPMSLTILITTQIWARLRPNDYSPLNLPMDMYFEMLGKNEEKQVLGLETMEEQMSLLYENISLKRQKEMLMDLVNDKQKTEAEILKMDECYRTEDLDCLREQIFSNGTYNENELYMMVYARNKRWMKTIVSQIKRKSTFIAVGAGHLPGDEGLIGLLRKEGYTVRAVSSKL